MSPLSSSIGCFAPAAARPSTLLRNRLTASTLSAALIAFVFAYAAAIPFMNTTLIEGPIAKAWHGADIAYFVNLLVAALIYGGYRLVRARRAPPPTTDH